VDPGEVGRKSKADGAGRPADEVAGKSAGEGKPPGADAGPDGHTIPAPTNPCWLDLDPAGLFRPPDFRWRLASRLAAGEFVPAEWIDEWVRVGRRVLAVPPDASAVPTLAAAADARTLALDGPGPLRLEVEARLLARQPADAVADRTGLTAAAVEAYAALFYAVTDSLTHRGYVTHCVVGLHESVAAHAAHVRMLCYDGGPLVADAVFDALADPVLVGAGRGPDAAELRRLVRLALELRAEPVTEANGLRWVRLGLLQARAGRAG